ncbi:TonB-dependent receptor [Sphingosinicella sp. LHD-64]|uniref:TonB-dependent receptor domain-containing protein n=1 Tax=Sphingosinicella sp. LHD-64 TaxID=3072139 RepID=UPI00280D68A8|nr:TonB-dependent receptor [Sphingosinicella sp. LHD-64]MDQ8755492.1 TonB-dependent receptor [Sphingosinicella sp. LHD-64]
MRRIVRDGVSRLPAILLSSGLFWGAAAGISAPAVAQEAATQPPDSIAPSGNVNAEGDTGTIVITGSRLVRTDLTAPSPTTIVGEADIELSGNVTIENTLNEFPQLASGNTSSVNNGGGSGVLTANLRGLGATRTLVLTNGRRFIPANSDGLVDLSTIPDALVERVEVITGGASAVYGSDAIAGAVNFILKNDFEGLEVSYLYGQTFRDDGASHKIDATFGTNFSDDRGNIVLSASYTKRDPVFQANRDFAQVPLDTINGELVPGGSGNVPGTRIGLSSAQLAQLVGVNLTPDGPCTNLNSIVFRENGVPGAYCTPENAYNYAPFNYLLRPLERIQVSGLARYEVADNVELFTEIFYVNTRNNTVLAPESFAPLTPGAPSQTLLVPNYATNPGLQAAVRNFFVNNAAIFDPDGDGTAAVVGAARRADELGTRDSFYERNSINITAGARGNFDLLGGPWRWEVFYQYQRNRADTRLENFISLTRLSQGLDVVVNGAGQVVCRNANLGCVPVNIFGYGSITPEAGRFITPPRVSDELFTRQVVGASLSGALFNLPAGPVAVAAGVEARRDQYDFNPSPQDLAGEYGPGSQAATGGRFNLMEFFGEMRVPILSGQPFAETLAIEGAVRYSDYSTIGGVFTWKVGGEYAPVSWLRFRSAYNRAIRAPTLNELFQPIATGFSSGEDPCIASRQPTAAQQQLCIAQGVPAADLPTFTQAGLGFLVRSGGNPNLQEERSKTLTVGAVIQPPFLDRLNITVDYFKVQVDNAIATINANQTINDCFANLDINSTTCQAIFRLSNGQIDFVSTQLSNIGSLKVEGIDAQADYRIPLGAFASINGQSASLNLQAVASWLFERSTQVLSNQAPLDCAGYFGGGCTGTGVFATPDFKLNLSGTYNSGPVTVRLQGRMIDGLELRPNVTAAVEEVGAQWYFDLAGRVRIGGNFELFGGIDNLFDNKPPILGTALSGDANTDVSLYDVIGRRFFIGGTVTF